MKPRRETMISPAKCLLSSEIRCAEDEKFSHIFQYNKNFIFIFTPCWSLEREKIWFSRSYMLFNKQSVGLKWKVWGPVNVPADRRLSQHSCFSAKELFSPQLTAHFPPTQTLLLEPVVFNSVLKVFLLGNVCHSSQSKLLMFEMKQLYGFM